MSQVIVQVNDRPYTMQCPDGEEDHLRPAVQAEGRLDLWQIAIKPGKPLAFGEVNRAGGGTAYFIGLPGNPVSSFITFLLAVRPLLLHLQGATDWQPRGITLRADFDWPRPDKRREFLRVRLNERGGLELFANQGSGVLTSLAWADGLVDLPPGQSTVTFPHRFRTPGEYAVQVRLENDALELDDTRTVIVTVKDDDERGEHTVYLWVVPWEDEKP